MIDRSKKLPAVFYQAPSGNEPLKEWIKTLSPADRQIVGRDIQMLEFGWPGNFWLDPGSHGSASRLYQKYAEDAAQRYSPGI